MDDGKRRRQPRSRANTGTLPRGNSTTIPVSACTEAPNRTTVRKIQRPSGGGADMAVPSMIARRALVTIGLAAAAWAATNLADEPAAHADRPRPVPAVVDTVTGLVAPVVPLPAEPVRADKPKPPKRERPPRPRDDQDQDHPAPVPPAPTKPAPEPDPEPEPTDPPGRDDRPAEPPPSASPEPPAPADPDPGSGVVDDVADEVVAPIVTPPPAPAPTPTPADPPATTLPASGSAPLPDADATPAPVASPAPAPAGPDAPRAGEPQRWDGTPTGPRPICHHKQAQPPPPPPPTARIVVYRLAHIHDTASPGGCGGHPMPPVAEQAPPPAVKPPGGDGSDLVASSAPGAGAGRGRQVPGWSAGDHLAAGPPHRIDPRPA